MVHPPNLNNNATSKSNDNPNSSSSNAIPSDQINEESEPPNPKGGSIHHAPHHLHPQEPRVQRPALSITSTTSSSSSSSPSEKQTPILPQSDNVIQHQSQGAAGTESSLSSIPPALHQPHTLTSNQTIQLLLSDLNHGLDAKEAESRLNLFGPNQIKEIKGASAWTIFLRQCANALTLVLVAAMALSFGVKDWVEGAVVTAVIVTNVLIGFIQEFKAERMMASLRSLSSPTATVLRSSNIVVVQSSELVIGDIVLFRTGDVLPSDVRLLEMTNLEIDEAPLTGESVPAIKMLDVIDDPLSTLGASDRINCAFSGTTVTKGRGRGIVIATGMQTQIGLIAQAMEKEKKNDHSIPFYKKWWEASAKWLGLREGTPLQIRLNKLAYLLLGLAVLCAIIVFSVAEFDITNEVVLYAIALGIGVIPESLVAVLTITFSVGAKRMAKSNVVVRRLDALEALGGVNNICSDKTGTLTEGKMVVKKLWTPSSSSQDPSSTIIEGASYDVDQTGASAFDPKGEISVSSESEKKEALVVGNLPSPVEGLCTAASLCNVAELVETDGVFSARGDPTEIALAVLAAKAGVPRESLLVNATSSSSSSSSPKEPPRYELENEWPFDSSIKRMTTSFIDSQDLKKGLDSTRTLFMKGAVEKVLECCNSFSQDGDSSAPLDKEAKKQILDRMEKMASSGLRVLAFATGKVDQVELERQAQELASSRVPTFASSSSPDDEADSIKVEKAPTDKGANSRQKPLPRTLIEQDLTFIGFAGLYDPPRPETRGSVLACQTAGITVRMLTGDHLETARAIAREVGILDGTEGRSAVMSAIEFDSLSDSQVDALDDLPLVVARCSPTTKVNMIQAGKRRGLYMAMTGDGINDAPALKQAPIGIAMGLNGTDVAKDSADLILVDDKFDSIVAGVREGRTVFDNIQRFIIALLVANVGEVILLLVGLAFRDGNNDSVFPLSPIQILWANMVTASLPAIGLGLEVGGPEIMKRKPHNLKDGIFSRAVICDLLFYGWTMGWTCLVTFIVMIYGIGGGQLGLGCNETISDQCNVIFEARSTVFTALILQLLLICWELISIDQTFFSKTAIVHLWRNKMLFWSVIFGAATIPICLYIPGFNEDVFRHSPLYGPGWGVAIAATVIFIASVELWKWLARRGAWPWLARVSGGSVVAPEKSNDEKA